MAILIKKKAPEPELTPEDHAAMVAAGLIPEVKATTKGIVIKRANQFNVDDRVRVTNDKFYWVKHYKAGDTGTIVKLSTPQTKMNPTDTPVTIFHVLLDAPRVPGQEVVLLSGWEMGAIK